MKIEFGDLQEWLRELENDRQDFLGTGHVVRVTLLSEPQLTGDAALSLVAGHLNPNEQLVELRHSVGALSGYDHSATADAVEKANQLMREAKTRIRDLGCMPRGGMYRPER